MKKIMISGGRGYLGSRLITFLETKGYEIISLSRASVPLKHWTTAVEEINIDWDNLDKISSFLKQTDCVIHLAGANEIESSSNPLKALNDTAVNTYKLINAAAKAGVKRFIYLSTAHIYGAPLTGEITENTIPRPVHPYASTHRTAEDFVIEMHDKNLIEAVIVRLSNGFGYPELKDINRWTLVVNDLCRTAVEKNEIRLKTSGEQKRDFITIHDFCRGMDFFINFQKALGKENIFNLGGEYTISIKEMAEKISQLYKQITGNSLPVVTGMDGPAKNELNYSIERIKKAGFSLEKPVDFEIQKTIEKCFEWYGNK
jgi:UDP-glucose 4-epimerase